MVRSYFSSLQGSAERLQIKKNQLNPQCFKLEQHSLPFDKWITWDVSAQSCTLTNQLRGHKQFKCSPWLSLQEGQAGILLGAVQAPASLPGTTQGTARTEGSLSLSHCWKNPLFFFFSNCINSIKRGQKTKNNDVNAKVLSLAKDLIRKTPTSQGRNCTLLCLWNAACASSASPQCKYSAICWKRGKNMFSACIISTPEAWRCLN